MDGLAALIWGRFLELSFTAPIMKELEAIEVNEEEEEEDEENGRIGIKKE